MSLKEIYAPHLGRNIKFGRKRPVALGPHFKLRNYLRKSLPSPPSSVDWSPAALPSLRNIYGNDVLGDCVIAEGYHAEGVATGNAGNLFVATPDQITADYSAIGGYVPDDPSTDNGCDEVTAMNYWTSHGYANGTKLDGWLTVNAADIVEVQTCIFLFGEVDFCAELPDTYVTPFPSGDGWTWGPGSPDPNNGHSFGGFGYDSNGSKIDTWAEFGNFTYDAISGLCVPAAGGGCYVRLTPDMLAKGQTKAPNGVDWSSLIGDFDSMGGNVPVPAPPPAPPPAPTPGSPVTLAQAQAWANAGLAAAHPLLLRSQAESIVKAALAKNWPTS
jgi:hypothetical protein